MMHLYRYLKYTVPLQRLCCNGPLLVRCACVLETTSTLEGFERRTILTSMLADVYHRNMD